MSALQWGLFKHREEMAAAALDDLKASAAVNPLWYQLSLEMGVSQSLDITQLRAIFDAGRVQFPEYWPLYSHMLRGLMPRWSGSYEKVDRFIREVSNRPAALTLGGVLDFEKYARLYWIYSSLEGDDTNIFTDAMARWPLMKQGFETLVTHHPASDVILNAFARSACIADDAKLYAELRIKLAKRMSSSEWTDQYSVESCDKAMAGHYGDQIAKALDNRDYDLAIEATNAALALDPHSEALLAQRGLARALRGDAVLAEDDLNAAFTLNPRDAVVFRGRGVLASRSSRYAEAVAALNTSLQLAPGDVISLIWRARALAAENEHTKALDDAAEVLRLRPDMLEMHQLRASIFRRQGKPEEVVREADAIIAKSAIDTRAWLAAAAAYASVDKSREALNALDRVIALTPRDVSLLLLHASYRPKGDLAGRSADVSEALGVKPRSTTVLTMRAEIQAERGHYAEAIETLNTAIGIDGGTSALLTARAITYAQAGQMALADTDASYARARSATATALQTLCSKLAAAGVALEVALAACDAAAGKSPDARLAEIRGFVLLRMRRYDEAIATYDSELRRRPYSAESLYGRGIARRRKGDSVDGDVDVRRAISLDATVTKEFESRGVGL